MANRWGKSGKSDRFYFRELQNHCEQCLQLWNLKTLAPWKKSYDKPRQRIKKQRHHFVNKSPSSQRYGFSSSHVRMWEMDHKEGRMLKNWCFWIVLEETLESPLDCKESKPVNAKQSQPWVFTERTCWSWSSNTLAADMKRLIGKDPDTGKNWRQRRRGQQRMRWLDNITDTKNMNLSKLREGSGGQRSLVCYSPWGCKDLDTT